MNIEVITTIVYLGEAVFFIHIGAVVISCLAVITEIRSTTVTTAVLAGVLEAEEVRQDKKRQLYKSCR